MRLENVKEGDVLAVYENGRLSKKIAERCTKTQVRIGSSIYLRRTGRLKGTARWDSRRAEIWDPGHDLEIIEESRKQYRGRMYNAVCDYAWNGASLEQLISVVELMTQLGMLAKHEDK